MTRDIFRLFSKGCLTLAAFACCLSAAPISYTLTNLTASGGDPTYSIVTNVTFTNLTLRQTFADATSTSVPLYDFTNTVQTSLTTSLFDLHSLTLNTVDPIHGNLVSSDLTGSFNPTQLAIVTSLGGAPLNVPVVPNFTATLLANSSLVNINAVSAAGVAYAAGTLESFADTSAVPEPATYGVAVLGLLGIYAVSRRNRVA